MQEPVQAVRGRTGIEEYRFPLPVKRNMRVAEKDDVSALAPPLPLDGRETEVHAKRIAVGHHHRHRADLPDNKPLRIEVAREIDVAAHADDRRARGNIDMKEVSRAVAAMDEAVKRALETDDSAEFYRVAVGIRYDEDFQHLLRQVDKHHGAVVAHDDVTAREVLLYHPELFEGGLARSIQHVDKHGLADRPVVTVHDVEDTVRVGE